MRGNGDRKVVFTLLGIVACCLLGLGGSLYRTKVSQLNQLRGTLTEKRNQLDELNGKRKHQPELEAKFVKLQDRLSVLEPALPDSAYIPTFLHQIERLATSTQNRILMIRPKPKIAPDEKEPKQVMNNETGEMVEQQPEKSKKKKGDDKPELPYDFVPIELKIEGNYWSVINFLDQLQRFPKMIAVNDIGIYPSAASGNSSRSPEIATTMDLTAVVTKGTKNGEKK